jgi:hypothetical protein
VRPRVYFIAFCFSVCSVATSICFAGSDQKDRDQQLIDQVNALRAEVQELRTQLNARGPQTQPAVPAASNPALTTEQMLRDVDRHTNLLDWTDTTAGFVKSKGFYIRSDDGNFLLHPWAFVQVRNTTNYREFGKHATDSDTENGFELPRMKFVLDGNILTPDLTYQIIWATSDTTGNLGLQDAWARYHIPHTDFAVRGGQIRDPFDHEQILYGTRSLTPERSIVNNVFANGDGIVKGASVSYGYDANSPVRTEIALTNGERNFSTTFQTFPTNTADWGAAGRVELKLMGKWEDYTQFTALGDKQDLLVVGAGADYTEAGSAGALMHVVDVQFDTPDRLTLYAAYLGRYTRHNAGAVGTNGGATATTTVTHNTYDSTFRLMAGYLVNPHLEPFARYEYIHVDRSEIPATSHSAVIHDITVGFNYYLLSHRAKFSAAASYLPNASPIANTLGDLLVAPRGNEVIIQAQFQLIL